MKDCHHPVAVSLLTRGDIERLGTTFTRVFALPHDGGQFANLIAYLDERTGAGNKV